METATIIQTENLTKVYGGRAAVSGLTFQLQEGEIFGFLGPNGAGKTTTLLMLLGLTEPTSGTVKVLGLTPARNPIQVKSQVGYLQENMGFYGDLNAGAMLRFVADLNRIPRDVSQKRIQEALTVVGLADEATKKIATYSRGMRQRLGIAELLVKRPKIVFMDEPTLGLDPDSTNRVMAIIADLCSQRKMTVLLSSHMLQQVQKICHRVGIMIKGRLVACDTPLKLAREKFGLDDRQYSLEEIYMRYFQET